ncbi:MAG: beta-N-acetylhexosaminidase [Terriglobales bacterium]
MKTIKWIFACIFGLSLLSHAQVNDVTALKLLPAPKEVRLGEGKLAIKPSTTILIGNTEDRLAAETLQEEIHERAGIKLAIEIATSAPKTAGHISLGRLSDRGLRGYLEAQGIKTESDLGDQGYVIRSSTGGVIVAGHTAQGVFYGVQTLRQLLHDEEGSGTGEADLRSGTAQTGEPSTHGRGRSATGKLAQLFIPAVTIRDWPSMEWRGVSDDMSRGPILTLDYLKFQIRTFAEYKINLLGFNMENIFDFQSQSLVSPKDAAFTPAEITELVSYAGKYFVTLMPEQQTFGHLHQFLKYEIYSDAAETPHGHVLTPTNPRTYDFIRQVYGEVVPLFPGPFFHIGADETFELGLGQTKALADQEGLGRVYLDHLQKVFEIMRPYHKQLMFWGDIAVKYPELLSILPKDMIAVPWDYDPKPSYESIITPYTNAGLRVVVAPGANNWNSIWPDFDAAFVNIRNFVRDGQNHRALGELNTIWHDDGETITDMTWPALVFGAAAGWQPGESNIDDFKKSYDWAFYRNSDSTFMNAIDSLDHVHPIVAPLKLASTNELFWSNPFSVSGAELAAKAAPSMHDVRLGAEHAIQLLQLNQAKAQVHRETLPDMLFAAWRLDALGMKIQFTAEMNSYYWDAYQNQSDPARVQHDLEEIMETNGRLESLRDAITQLKKTHAEAWGHENHSHWLDNVLVRYDNLAMELQAKVVAVVEAQRQYWTTKTLPPPEQLGFFLKP